MNEKVITLGRKELYKLVWKKPMCRLAPEYGISDVGLKKICKKLNVPTPPRGYWVKMEFGIKVSRTPLPRKKYGQPETHTIQPGVSQKNTLKKSYEDSTPVPAEIGSAKPIIVRKKLRNPHPLVVETQRILEKGKPDKYGVLRPWRKQYLNIRVGPDSLKRALRIMDALLKCFDEMGFEVSTHVYQVPTTYVHILGEKIRVYLKEKTRQVDHKLTDEEKKDLKRYGHSFAPRWDYIPTGKLSLIIDEWGTYDIKKNWSDTKSKRIEDMLNDFIISVYKIAYIDRQRRLEREEEQRRRRAEQEKLAEEARRREAEQKRLLDFESQALMWAKSEQLRVYIKEVEKRASLRQCSMVFRKRFDDWMSWAKQHADRIDPLDKKLPFEIDF